MTVRKPLPPEQDTQAAKNHLWRINLDHWQHVEETDCDQLRPHYNAGIRRDGHKAAEWVCLVCDEPVRVKA